MSHLLDYLNTQHKTLDVSRMEADFQEQFGVSVQQEGNLFLFKYALWNANFDKPVTHECRGAILRYNADGDKGPWSFVCRPFDKFFNLHEFGPFKAEQMLERDYFDLEAVEKVDGTMVCLWFDHEQKQWRCSTQGAITPKEIHGHPSGLTFGELFERLFVLSCALQNGSGMYALLPASPCTYLFEMVAPEIRLYCDSVTEYPKASLTLIGIRQNETGRYIPPQDDINYLMVFNKIRRPYTYPLPKEYKNVGHFERDLHRMARQDGNMGRNPEGFVLVNKRTLQPVAKVKLPEWVLAHQQTKGNTWAVSLTRAVIQGNMDDALAIVPLKHRDRAHDFAEHLYHMVLDVFDKARALRGINPVQLATPRQYAEAVRGLNLGAFQDLFFRHKNAIMQGDEATADALKSWWSDDPQRELALTKKFIKERKDLFDGAEDL